MLKGGAVRTSAGSVLFMIWWFPPLINNSPFAAYELLASPEPSPTGRQLLAAASRQKHLHLVILDEHEEILDVVALSQMRIVARGRIFSRSPDVSNSFEAPPISVFRVGATICLANRSMNHDQELTSRVDITYETRIG